jgi:GntR family transcriptional regulator
MFVKEPVYLQLTQELREFIRRGHLSRGSRFLTEREISSRFAVSRPTANKALASLVAEGVLEFRKGIGTFVRGEALDYDLRALVSYTDKARAAGKRPSTRVLRWELLSASTVDQGVQEALRVEARDCLYEAVRLRLAGEVPVILEYRYVVARHCPGLERDDFAGSLYAVWTERCGLAIAGADETIRAINLCAAEAALLEVEASAAALEVVSVGYTGQEEPLWWERTLYQGAAYELSNCLGPIQHARPAAGVSRVVEGKDDRHLFPALGRALIS